jgi:membrane-associated protein
MPDVVDGLLHSIGALDPVVVGLVVAAFMVVETSVGVGLVVPGDGVVLLAGSTVTGPGRFALVVAAAVTGSLIGETIGWLLGRHYGDRIRTSRAGRMVGARSWARAESFLNGGGGRALIGARFVAVVHAVAPVVAGSVGMPYRRFAAWCGLGTLVWSVAFTTAGYLAGASWREYGHRMGMAGWIAAGVLAATIVIVRARRRRRLARLEPDPDPEPEGAGVA